MSTERSREREGLSLVMASKAFRYRKEKGEIHESEGVGDVTECKRADLQFTQVLYKCRIAEEAALIPCQVGPGGSMSGGGLGVQLDDTFPLWYVASTTAHPLSKKKMAAS